jgi:hypothetical protein
MATKTATAYVLARPANPTELAVEESRCATCDSDHDEDSQCPMAIAEREAEAACD